MYVCIHIVYIYIILSWACYQNACQPQRFTTKPWCCVLWVSPQNLYIRASTLCYGLSTVWALSGSGIQYIQKYCFYGYPWVLHQLPCLFYRFAAHSLNIIQIQGVSVIVIVLFNGVLRAWETQCFDSFDNNILSQRPLSWKTWVVHRRAGSLFRTYNCRYINFVGFWFFIDAH